MTQELEKAIALLQHQGTIVFYEQDNETFYIGTQEDADEKWSEYLVECEDDEIEPISYLKWLNENFESIDVEEYDEDTSDYLVYTDSEANEAWEKDLDNYIDECILPEIHERYRAYFDENSWKIDARMDGRGHSLGRYDGHENEEQVNGTTYYIYRVN